MPASQPLVSVVVAAPGDPMALLDVVDDLDVALGLVRWELVLVSGSRQPGTVPDLLRTSRPWLDVRWVRADRRPQGRAARRRGFTAGIDAARAELVIVWDASWIHPPAMLRQLVDHVALGEADVALASRFLSTGTDGRAGRTRPSWSSTAARWSLGRLLPATRLLSDPRSPLFAASRASLITAPSVEGRGVLAALVSAGQWRRIFELPATPERRPSADADLATPWSEARAAARLRMATRPTSSGADQAPERAA